MFPGLDLPIAGIAGDQQSALFGQTCFDVGDSKCTYGTGSFILTNTGTDAGALDAGPAVHRGLALPRRRLTYALEGAIFVTGAAVQWLRDGLQIVGSAAETAAIAATVDDTEGVVFVPALTGLGAPHWDPHARGLIIGITRGTTRAHIVRATLEAIAFEVRDVLETMPERGGLTRCASTAAPRPTTCSASCRPTRSACRSSGPRSWRPPRSARRSWPGSAPGCGGRTDDLRETWQLDRRFEPGGDRAPADAAHARWRDAVEPLQGLGEPLGPRASRRRPPRRPRAASAADDVLRAEERLRGRP